MILSDKMRYSGVVALLLGAASPGVDAFSGNYLDDLSPNKGPMKPKSMKPKSTGFQKSTGLPSYVDQLRTPPHSARGSGEDSDSSLPEAAQSDLTKSDGDGKS